jgi:hypothetical protein
MEVEASSCDGQRNVDRNVFFLKRFFLIAQEFYFGRYF